MSTNLWGDLSSFESKRTPVTILREQAGYLTQSTNGILRGVVDHVTDRLSSDFIFDLDVVAPILNDYRYTILRIKHDINLFPLIVFDYGNDARYECPDENFYLEALKKILTSAETRKIVGSLIAQSKA